MDRQAAVADSGNATHADSTANLHNACVSGAGGRVQRLFWPLRNSPEITSRLGGIQSLIQGGRFGYTFWLTTHAKC